MPDFTKTSLMKFSKTSNSKPHFVWNSFNVKFLRNKLGDDAAEKILYALSVLIAVVGIIMVIM